MIDFIVHDNEGRILRSGLCQKETIHLQAGDGESVMAGKADDTKQYIDCGRAVARPVFDPIIRGLNLSGLPTGVEVYVDNVMAGQCDSGCVEIEKESELDTVEVRLTLFPYIDKEIVL